MSCAHLIKEAKTHLVLCLIVTQLLFPSASQGADNTVSIAGSSAFMVRTGSGGYSATQRSAIIQKNLDNALVASANRQPSAVSITYVKGLPVLTLGGFYIATADAANAKLEGTTPAGLAQRWANGLRRTLMQKAAVEAYVARLQGADPGLPVTQPGGMPFRQGRVVHIPQGMTLPVTLRTSISSSVAKPGDPIQAEIAENIQLADAVIPAGTTIMGEVVDAATGRRLGKSGTLALKFTRMRMADGSEAPISARIVSDVGKLREVGEDQFRGESVSSKVKKTLLDTAIGVGAGAVLGTTIGAIAGGSRGAGRGAWSGAAIGGGIGAVNALVIRKGKDANIRSGERMTLQLDAPASLAVGTSQGVF